MVRSLLVRGLLVGLLAGVLAFAFALAFGEPQVEAAIAFEELVAARSGAPPEAELVSRGVQRTIGLSTGTVALGVALGGLFALVYAYAYGRVGIVGARPMAAALAFAAFATITLVPFTKYPANPPAVGDPATIDQRTLLGFAMVAITAVALVAAVRVRAELLARLGAWNAAVVAGGVFVASIAVAQLLLPSLPETPPGFPADVLYDFRLASLGTNATLWLVIGLGFGAAAERLLVRSESERCGA
ncbi:MAG: Predicted cobalt transporter CbtA [uncultured Solirubrobacteraceae bacterium]|uniref:Predicted cobalt transporter CbtA n=1 Tax=uncultured Solirubrobacteraceae bacterium TaxID=1162706 RepID=A0A6J4RF04_9ACTN|nr:MAG: Predicted cobalt transporter CbtA [uncultured Solirubrobacteraceae bacterium]